MSPKRQDWKCKYKPATASQASLEHRKRSNQQTALIQLLLARHLKNFSKRIRGVQFCSDNSALLTGLTIPLDHSNSIAKHQRFSQMLPNTRLGMAQPWSRLVVLPMQHTSCDKW